MSISEDRVAQREVERIAACHYCQESWPFFGTVDGRPLPFHHRPEDPDWHARLSCLAVHSGSTGRPVQGARRKGGRRASEGRGGHVAVKELWYPAC